MVRKTSGIDPFLCIFKFPFIELFHGERFTVGAANIRPKSFDFADAFYKSYRIIVPIIRAANSRPFIGQNETVRQTAIYVLL